MSRHTRMRSLVSTFSLTTLCCLAASILLTACSSPTSRNRKQANKWKQSWKTSVVMTTGYCECQKCCNWERNWLFQPVIASGPYEGRKKVVGKTASGTMAQYGTLAADTTYYPFGTIIYIEGYGYGRVEDRGGAIKGQRLDLFFESHDDALEWGRQTVVIKYKLPKKYNDRKNN